MKKIVMCRIKIKLRRAIRLLADKVLMKINWFDISNNIETGVPIDKELLYDSIDYSNKQHMTRYVATDLKQLKKSLNQLVAFDKSILNNTLIDFGCGKGRVLIMAERMGFRNVIGIEFSKKLYDICRNNLKKTKTSVVDVVHGDAVDYKLSGDIRIFYFYNPFDFYIFEKVLNNIKEYLKTKSSDGYIVYIDPRTFGRLDPSEFELLFSDDCPANPFHIYKV